MLFPLCVLLVGLGPVQPKIKYTERETGRQRMKKGVTLQNKQITNGQTDRPHRCAEDHRFWPTVR